MSKIKEMLQYLLLTVSAALSIAPFLWMLTSITNSSKDIVTGKMTLGSALADNVQKLVSETEIFNVFLNSFAIAVMTTLTALTVSSMAGYAFQVFRTRFMNRLFGIIMISMMIPFAAVMIPLFRMVSGWGLLDTLIAVVLPYCTSAFLIFFFRQNTKGFPKALIDAARIDGLGEFGIFCQVYLPSMRPAYGAAAIITFMTAWNNYMWPLIAIQSGSRRTLPLLIANLASSYQPDYGVIMLVILVATLPIMLLFLGLQKFFVEGLTGYTK